MGTYKVKDISLIDFAPAFSVVTKEIDTPNQGVIKRYIVDHKPVVSALIYDKIKKVFYMGEEYRSGINRVTTGNCAGYIDDGETEFEAVCREVKEELGLTNLDKAEVIEIGKVSSSEGFTNEVSTQFYFEGDFGIGETSFDDGEYIKLIELSPKEVQDRINSGKISGSKTVLAFYWWKLKQLEK